MQKTMGEFFFLYNSTTTISDGEPVVANNFGQLLGMRQWTTQIKSKGKIKGSHEWG